MTITRGGAATNNIPGITIKDSYNVLFNMVNNTGYLNIAGSRVSL
jgi:hypothetical protein